MIKLLGTGLILCSGGYALWHYRSLDTQYEKKLQELIASLEYMATEIRWKHRRLPEIFDSLSRWPNYGMCFQRISADLKRHQPLQGLFQQAFSCLDMDQFAAIEALKLSGDEKQITQELLYVVGNLKAILQAHRSRKRERWRILTALVCCFTGFLVILLI